MLTGDTAAEATDAGLIGVDEEPETESAAELLGCTPRGVVVTTPAVFVPAGSPEETSGVVLLGCAIGSGAVSVMAGNPPELLVITLGRGDDPRIRLPKAEFLR